MKYTLFFILFFIVVTESFGQVGGSDGYLPNYGPPSPEASALGKYVEHPVGNFTGTPKIDIPLFEIKTGRITLPISLSYHGSGIKVDEVASRAGIGWVLNAGGFITRTVKGFPDDVSPGYGFCYFENLESVTPSIDAVELIDLGRDRGVVSNQYDLEPDVHFYNFGHKSGKMYFLNRTTAFTTDNDPMKIEGPYNGSNHFVITTEDGLVYTFDAAEGTSSIVYSGAYGTAHRYISTWYLTNIYDPVTDKSVRLTYRADMLPVLLNYSYQRDIHTRFACSSPGYNGMDNQIVNPMVLDRISYDEGYIEFKADHSRQDLTGDRAYTEINQYINGGGTPLLKKGFNLSYAYTSNGAAQENRRMYLESLQEKGSDGSLLPPYLFYYKNRDQLPERNSPQQDIWGYYNANGVANTGSPQLPKVYVRTDGARSDYLPFESSAFPATSIIAGVERSSNPVTIDYGTLNKVIYPTKGYTTYIYEVHQFGAFLGGGIRIKEIDDYSASGQEVLTKKYTYSGGFLGGPLPQVAYPAGQELAVFSQNQSVLGSCQGSYVGYEVVNETQDGITSSKNGKTSYVYSTDQDVEDNFTVVNNFPGCQDLSDLSSIRKRSYFPFFEMESREDRRGLLLEEAYDDAAGKPLKLISYRYTLSSTPKITVHSSYMIADIKGRLKTNLRSTRNIYAERMLLTSKTEGDYKDPISRQDPPSILNEYFYTYVPGKNGGQFLREESRISGIVTKATRDREGNILTDRVGTTYQYPFDFPSTDAVGTMGIMGRMVEMNYINPVITETKWRSKDINEEYYYTEGRLTNYKLNPFSSAEGVNLEHSIVPSEVYELNLVSPIPVSSVTASDPGNPGPLYQKRLEYLSYDSNGNPIAIVHDGQYEQFQWAFFRQLLLKAHTTSLTDKGGQRTIYNYDSLHRLQSITDPSMKVRSFEYDPFSRLINIKDNNGNILQHNEYHYKP